MGISGVYERNELDECNRSVTEGGILDEGYQKGVYQMSELDVPLFISKLNLHGAYSLEAFLFVKLAFQIPWS